MPRRQSLPARGKKPRLPRAAPAAAPDAANPLHAYRRAYRDWAEAAGYSPATTRTRDVVIVRFIAWADERGLTRPTDITRAMLERYQRHLYLHRKADGTPLSFRTQQGRLNPLRAWFKWLVRQNHVLYNPAAELVLPRVPRQLPKVLFSVAEVEHILNQPDVTTASGIRDRAMLETFYSSAVRRMELARLSLYDADLAQGTLMIRQGKGRRDRLIPLGARACAWLHRYLDEVRPMLVLRHDETVLFLNDYGDPFSPGSLAGLVKYHLRRAGIAQGSCHAFRHACATHMLENGADIRFIQAMLGHAQLTTTEIYTHVSIQKLKEIHAATHPARLTRNRGEAQRCSPGLDDEAQAFLAAVTTKPVS